MEEIKHTYTIQWVGPLTYDEYKGYVKGTDTIAPSYFNFYYFEARKDARCRWHRYVGIHKQNDGIEKRLNMESRLSPKPLTAMSKTRTTRIFG